ncbi:alpha/beta fold hydrolase [Pseudonocardia sp. H11422]|uniref:alpha/beta fold hydrolase n=1 Tax=Pseudonocardia sp. H11422 TaxID=2835866 RepID=UPI001BDC1A35|nr:alpha/beta fold hydrolase [Pseudonocardia sp. H11422]
MSNYYSEEQHGPHQYLELGDFELENGITLPGAKLSYKTHGTLNQARDNAILFPHMWSGTPKAMEIFVGEDRPLNPNKYFVILPGQFANGFSSSPSNTPPPFNGGAFPHVTIGDDVRAQHRLVTETFEIERLELVLGWSMGAEQTYEWAVRFPEMVKRALPFAGTAKTTPHDYLFVRSHEEAIKSDPAWDNGFYKDSTDVHVGLRRHAMTWSVMGLSQEFYNTEAWRAVGFTSLDDFVQRFWEAYFLPMDPNNLIWMAWKWRHGDVSIHTGGDLKAALGRIRAKTYVVPFSRDMFFPPQDCEAEQKLIPNSEFRVIDSLWAHFAMFCMTPSDREQIDACISDLLKEEVP